MSYTATEIEFFQNARRHRAEGLVYAVMRVIEDHLHPRANKNAIVSDLLRLFERDGIEVLSDNDREMIGLPPRGPYGWTEDELRALELRRLEVLSTRFSLRNEVGP